jgi:uncharacterized protein (TIGR02996 family)
MEEEFLESILAEPRDDGNRLVYADWLDERGGPGDAARAEFIRLGVAEPERTFWAAEPFLPRETDRAAELFRERWLVWMDLLCQRLEVSPLRRWIGKADCRLGFRRGFIAILQGTEQVVLEAWTDLFRLGPVEDVHISNLWNFGIVLALRQFLNRPSLRILHLHSRRLHEDCVNQLQRVAEWLRSLERVELVAMNINQSAFSRLTDWLAKDPSLKHVIWKGRSIF